MCFLTTTLQGRYHDYPVFLRLREVKSLAQDHTVDLVSDFIVHVHKVGVGGTDNHHFLGPNALGKPARDWGEKVREEQPAEVESSLPDNLGRSLELPMSR